MKTYKTIDDAIYEIAPRNIVRRKRKPTASLVLMIAGILIWIAAYTYVAGQPRDILILTGIVVACAGVVKMVIDITRRAKLYYRPSGSELRRYELWFDTPYRMRVCQALMEGDLASLAGIPKGHSEAVRAVIYKSEDDGVLMTQVLESKRPLTETRIFEKGKFTLTINLR